MQRQSKAKHQGTNNMDEESRGGFVPLDVSPAAAGGGLETGEQIIGKRKNDGLREQLHYFRLMSAPYFRENRSGRILFAILVVLMLLNSAVRVLFSYLARDFWNALSDKDEEKFYSIMYKFVGSMVLFAPIVVAYRFQRQKLAIAWRQWLTGRVLRLYFSNKVRCKN